MPDAIKCLGEVGGKPGIFAGSYAWKINKIFALKINKIPPFYLTFAQNVPTFYIMFARKQNSGIFLGGGGNPLPGGWTPGPPPVKSGRAVKTSKERRDVDMTTGAKDQSSCSIL